MSAFDDYLSAPAAQGAPSFDSYLGASAPVPAPAAGGTGAAAAQTAVGQQPGMLASLGAGLGHGVQQSVLGAQQLLGRGLTALGANTVGPWLSNDAEQGLARGNAQYAPYATAHPVTASVGNIGGQVAATAPLAFAAPEIGSMGLLERAATGAGLGAANGAVAPVANPGNDFWSQKLGQIGSNAAVGAIATPVTAGLGGAISGVTDPLRQKMAALGISMTPGQIAGGAWQTLENKATSLPLIGDMIRAAQQRGIQSFNNATYNQVLAPLGQKYSGPVGQDGVENVENAIHGAYDSALPNMTFRATDPQFQSDITNLAGLAQNLPAQQRMQFVNVLQNKVMGQLSPQGWMDGQTLKGTISDLGKMQAGLSGGNNTYWDRQLGNAVGEIKSAMSNSLRNYNAPGDVQALNNADAAWANFVRLQRAAATKGAADAGGVFTPSQLQGAVRASDNSARKGAFATGNALMQDFSQDAMGVLGKGYPDSGTAGRLGTAGAIGALFSHPGMLLSPWAYAAAAPALAYTPLGQRAAQGLLMSRPALAQPIGNAITNGLAPLAPGLLGATTH